MSCIFKSILQKNTETFFFCINSQDYTSQEMLYSSSRRPLKSGVFLFVILAAIGNYCLNPLSH